MRSWWRWVTGLVVLCVVAGLGIAGLLGQQVPPPADTGLLQKSIRDVPVPSQFSSKNEGIKIREPERRRKIVLPRSEPRKVPVPAAAEPEPAPEPDISAPEFLDGNGEEDDLDLGERIHEVFLASYPDLVECVGLWPADSEMGNFEGRFMLELYLDEWGLERAALVDIEEVPEEVTECFGHVMYELQWPEVPGGGDLLYPLQVSRAEPE